MNGGPRSSTFATTTRIRSTYYLLPVALAAVGRGWKGLPVYGRPRRVGNKRPYKSAAAVRDLHTLLVCAIGWQEGRRRAHLLLMAGYAYFSSLRCAQKWGPVSHGRGHPNARSLEDGGGHQALHAHATGGLRQFCRHCVQNGRRNHSPSRTPSYRSRELRRRDLGHHR